MMLTGDEIITRVEEGSIRISEFTNRRVNPNSYNVRLAPTLLQVMDDVLDFKRPYRTATIVIPESGFVLMPGECYLGATVEKTSTPLVVPHYEGRSTTGRYFLQSHMTAGFGDLGYRGAWTLEIVVQKRTRVYPFMEIGQIGFTEARGATSRQYAGSYAQSGRSWDDQSVPKPAKPNNIGI